MTLPLAPKAQTLIEKYYSLNTALNLFMQAQGVRAPIVKYGIDPATIKPTAKDQTSSRYPYFQSFILNPKPQAWTSRESGIYTRFEYQLSYFPSPDNEFENDAALYLPYNLARVAFSDINARVFLMVDKTTGQRVNIANLLGVKEQHSFSMVSGAPVPKAVLIAEMASICAYPQVTIFDPGKSTDLEHAWEYDDAGVPF